MRKYTTSIEIALPRQKVVDLISDPAQLPKWLRSLAGLETGPDTSEYAALWG